MTDLKDTVQVKVEYFTDEAAPYYVASSDELMFTTDGTTFQELLANVRECLSLALEDVDTAGEYGVIPNPRVQIVMELPENYAQTA